MITELGPAPAPAEVGKLLNLDRTTVYRMLYAGKLKKITGFGRVRICPKSLDALLAKTESHNAKPTGRWRKR